MLPDTEFYGHYVNKFTYPGWFCFVLWVIFFFSFIAFFEESIISYHNVSEPDRSSMMLTKSNEALKNINEQYFDDNLVKKDIDEIIKEERTTFSYIAVAFTILTLTLFLLRVNNYITLDDHGMRIRPNTLNSTI
jgi:hypothetical protein